MGTKGTNWITEHTGRLGTVLTVWRTEGKLVSVYEQLWVEPEYLFHFIHIETTSFVLTIARTL